MAWASALDGSYAVWRTSTRTRCSRANASIVAVPAGPIRCELCLGTWTFISRAGFVLGDIFNSQWQDYGKTDQTDNTVTIKG